MTYTAHVDPFARDHLPPEDQWPAFLFDLPELHYPQRMNCVVELLDKAIEKGWGDHVAILGDAVRWSYDDLLQKVNQCANVLTHEMGLVTGNRVLLHGANHPMMAVAWLAIAKAGLIAVTTMPLLRQKELDEIVERAQIRFALCDMAVAEEMRKTHQHSPILERVLYYNTDELDSLDSKMSSQSTHFTGVDTAADDTVIIAFTSGTTGSPKATMHFHRDVMAICDTFPRSMVKMQADDICIGSPPLGFTFGLGGLLLFPLRYGAGTVLKGKYTPESYLATIDEHRVTISWTSPFFYRRMAEVADPYDLSSLRTCVSAGEALPVAIRDTWRQATGIEMLDGIGATELLHIFISHDEENVRPGATGKPIPGYRAKVIDSQGNPVGAGVVGRLAVQGPTGCRYLADERQLSYVQDGWNITGDSYMMDEDGYFFYQARNDDMIVTTGYNVAGPEVEGALLLHDAIAECAVIGAPDPERGTIIKAYVVLREGYRHDAAMVKSLQDFVKETIAPYKYPRAVEFINALPRTQTGKVQRYVLRQRAAASAEQA